MARTLVDGIELPMVERVAVIDGLLDLRNVGKGRDLGLELTIDEMLEELPPGTEISAEWWMNCLSTIVDHAAYLAAGYPAVIPELEAA